MRRIAYVALGTVLGVGLSGLAAGFALARMAAKVAPQGQHVCGAAVGAVGIGFLTLGARAGALCGVLTPLVWGRFRRVTPGRD